MMLIEAVRPESTALTEALPHSTASALSISLCQAIEARPRMPGFSERAL